MTVTTDQDLETQPKPEPSSADDQTEFLIDNSDADMTGLLSGSKDEKETPDPPFNWADDV
jgi:hypothetical protein